jgi:hypothetical protein
VIIAAEYSFKGGRELIGERWPGLLLEIEETIGTLESSLYRTKQSREKTMVDRMLFDPPAMNRFLSEAFEGRGWRKQRVPATYPTEYYRPGYKAKALRPGAFREMDFVKDKLGIEIQFGKYAFMVYNVCAKMTIFRKLGFIDAGVEIVPVKSFADDMSTGVSYFEQFVWDLEQRGVADIDVPVLILGIDTPVEPERPPASASPFSE